MSELIGGKGFASSSEKRLKINFYYRNGGVED